MGLALMDEVFTGILHMERRNGVTCDFAAVSCFDSFPNNLMCMAHAKAGTNRNVVNLLGKSLRGEEY